MSIRFLSTSAQRCIMKLSGSHFVRVPSRDSVKSHDINYHKSRIHDGTWEVVSIVTTTYEDGSTREFSNWVANCATEEGAIATIINLKGLKNA